MVCTSDYATGQRGLVESSLALYGDLPAEARVVGVSVLMLPIHSSAQQSLNTQLPRKK